MNDILIPPANLTPATAIVPLPPVGAVLPYAGLLADTDAAQSAIDQIRANLVSAGWLFCDGAAYPITRYAQLYGVIGTSFGQPDAKSFNVPDLRGRFMRGVNGSASGGVNGAPDPQAASRHSALPGGATGNHVGSAQDDAFQGHEHFYTSTTEGPEQAVPDPDPPGLPLLVPLPNQPTTGITSDTQGDGQPRISMETRPVNLALNFIIRWA